MIPQRGKFQYDISKKEHWAKFPPPRIRQNAPKVSKNDFFHQIVPITEATFFDFFYPLL